MHVYHYGGYESGALKRLMQRHATREDEVDVLLRGRRPRRPLRPRRPPGHPGVASSRYSIKKIEKFYMPEREGGITRGRLRVVEYERWMETGDPAILDAIAAYNRDDCVSNLLLRDWLEGRRRRGRSAVPRRHRPAAGDRPTETRRRTLATAQAETRAREEALRADVPADRLERDDEQQGRWLLAALLDWHRREAKPQWWDYFRLVEAPLDDLVRDGSALGGPHVRRGPRARARSRASTAIGSTRRRRRRFARASPSIALAPGEDGWAQSTVDVIELDPLAGPDRPQAQRRRTRTRSR